MAELISTPILIRYDGLDADDHALDMALFADSLRGLSRTIGLVGNYAATGRYIRQSSLWEMRVLMRQPEPKCVEISAVLSAVAQHPLFQGAGGAIVIAVIQYVFAWAKGQRDEMKHLQEALIKAIETGGTTSREQMALAMATIEKLAQGSRSAVRRAVAPVGSTCTTMTIGGKHEGATTIDLPAKEAILAEDPPEIIAERTYRIRITEVDKDRRQCHFWFEGDEQKRYPAEITDPAFLMNNDPYSAALGDGRTITVKAKATARDGELQKLFISDTE